MPESLHSTIQRAIPYPIAFASVTGSHAFGMASDFSDYDIHGMYVLPLREIVGLHQGQTVIETKAEHPENGLTVEMHCYDVRHAVEYLLKGNGRFLEDVFSPLVVMTSPLHEELQTLALKHCFSRLLATYYEHHASTLQRKLMHNEVKKLLHMYRCYLTGLHLMETGRLEINLRTLADIYQQPQINEVIEAKLRTFSKPLGEETIRRHLGHVEGLVVRLSEATLTSPLPEKPSEKDVAAMENFLYRVRLENR